MSKNNPESRSQKANKSVKRERRDTALPTTPQNIKPPKRERRDTALPTTPQNIKPPPSQRTQKTK